MEERLGQVMASLERHGFKENTIFIYTSDQGSEWYRCKWILYDTGLRVPFIVRWPGKVEPGTVSEALVSFVDLLPTFIEIAGGSAPPELDGRSFFEVLRTGDDSFRDYLFASHTCDGNMDGKSKGGSRGGTQSECYCSSSGRGALRSSL